MKSVDIKAAVRKRICGDAVASHPQEACGILVGRVDGNGVRVHHAVPCRNEAPATERMRRFQIDPLAVLNVQRAVRPMGQRIVGFYHSHPEGPLRPSLTDLEYMCLWPDTVWLIVNGRADPEIAMRAWWLDVEPVGPVRELRVKNLTVRLLTPTVHREAGFAFRIYQNDHEPASVHAIKGAGFVTVELPGQSGRARVVKVGKHVTEQEVVRAVRIVERECGKFLEAWKKVHGEAEADG